MAAVTLLGTETLNTTSGTHTVVATPASGDLIVIVTASSGNTATTVPTDNNSDGLGTYTLISSALKSTSADVLNVYVRDALVGSATSTTFTHAPGASTGGGLAVLKVTGMSLTGASAVRQSAKQENQGAGGTPTPVFGAAALTANPVIGAVFNNTTPGCVPRSSPAYTERVDSGYITPTRNLEIMSINSGETGTSIAWGGTSATAFSDIVIELNIQAPPTVVLNSPADASSSSDTTPTLDFTGTDTDGDSVRYNAQIDTVSTFDSVPGTIVFDNSGSVNDTNSTVTLSYTITQANPVLVVALAFDDTGRTVSGVTYGGVALTRIGGISTTSSTGSQVDVWYLKAPARGTADIVATYSPDMQMGMMAMSFGDIDQIAPLDAFNSAEGNSTTPSVSLTTVAANTVIVDFGHHNSAGTRVTPTGGQTETIDANTPFDAMFAGYEIVSSAGANTESWSYAGGSVWAIFSVSFKRYTGVLLNKFSGGPATVTDIITSTGSWVAPSGVTDIKIEAWGAGGGGGGWRSGFGPPGGAGGGAYARDNSYTVTPGNSYTVTVGAGGTGGTSGGIDDATNGGDSGFGDNSTILAKGGSRGRDSTISTGGAGGTTAGSVGDAKFAGGNGADGSGATGGGGGGSAGDANAGGNASGATAGTGGSANGVSGGIGNTNPGGAGAVRGGGGGATVWSAGAGGNGGRGEVWITYTASYAGFVNPDTGGDTDPFNSGENIQYTVQAGDALAPGTYYWRVRGIDPSGLNIYGAWSSTRSFTITSGGATRVPLKGLLGVGT